MSSFRTDNNNNPTAFTTELAQEAGLHLNFDYIIGDPFESNGRTFFTAKLLGSPLYVTIKAIDRVGFYTSDLQFLRWSYIAIPFELWMSLTMKQKEYTIGQMYEAEGGTAMKSLFPDSPV